MRRLDLLRLPTRLEWVKLYCLLILILLGFVWDDVIDGIFEGAIRWTK